MSFKLAVLFLISCFAGIYGAATTAATSDKSNITVHIFYETYCLDSINFISKKVYPAYQSELGKFFTPKLYPFGLGQISSTGNITCHHEEKECIGNKIHACVLNMTTIDFATQFKFINCTLAKTNPLSKTVDTDKYPLEECAKLFNLNATDISTCATSEQGELLLKSYGIQTTKYNSTFVPFVIFNNETFDLARSNKTLSNFESDVCALISADVTKPGVCKSQPNNGATNVKITAILPVATVAIAFFVSKMYQF